MKKTSGRRLYRNPDQDKNQKQHANPKRKRKPHPKRNRERVVFREFRLRFGLRSGGLGGELRAVM